MYHIFFWNTYRVPISVLETPWRLHLGSCSPGLSRVLSANFRQGHLFLPDQGIFILEGEPQTGTGERAGLVRCAERLPGGETVCEKTLGHKRLRAIWRTPTSGGRYRHPLPIGSVPQRGNRGCPFSLSVFSSSHVFSLIGRLPNRSWKRGPSPNC